MLIIISTRSASGFPLIPTQLSDINVLNCGLLQDQPENLLLDSQGNLKISDFGLSALPAEARFEYVVIVSSVRIIIINLYVCRVSVLSHKGYNGALADVWSCGVILYVLMAGYLPFDEINYVPARVVEYEDVNLDDVNVVFDDSEEEGGGDEQQIDEDACPLSLNAFDMIILSQGLNLSSMFDRGQETTNGQRE
uniref:non-specific serine/threonine protein kinase n=1 Tax=Lactuca sativa TaxID=4236 RepID=A0A9R1UMD7_LACSA|nr:hypothetical protein LSAT_V11C800403930 [Lactuca sativa]